MSKLIEKLQSLNAKERYFLVGQILGNPTFAPSVVFREQLGKELHLSIPEVVFSAMDYHLDWVYASLQAATADDGRYDNHEGIIKAQQEDIDFLIAYDSHDASHVILIEAKGKTGWSNQQMNSKAERLRGIFGEDGGRWKGVIPHFVMMSPRRPQDLKTSEWPSWMVHEGTFSWMPIEIPEGHGLKRVTRCNAEGNVDINGKFWTLKSR